MHQRRTAIGACMALVLLCGACSGDGGGRRVADKAAETHKLTIGVRPDQPGLGQRTGPDRYAGFEIDVATRVASKLGAPATGITFVPVSAATRAETLTAGKVDLVVAQYPITADTKRRVAFAGPYLTAHFGFLVRMSGKGLSQVGSLAGRTICFTDAKGAESAVPGATWMRGKNDSDCLVKLLAKKVDAFAGLDAELAGYSAQNPGRMRLLHTPSGGVGYGIALRKDGGEAREEINSILKDMISDGSWAESLKRNLPGLAEARAPKIP